MERASDDPQFYGHPEERRKLEARVDQFNPSAWVSQHKNWGFGCPSRLRLPPAKVARLHNPYAGVNYAWQLTEALDDFLLRLPPATTDQTKDVPWIFICNPYVSREKMQAEGGGFMRGNEDEGPVQTGSQLHVVVQGGMERLELLAELEQKVKNSQKSSDLIRRELFQERRNASADILDLAHAGRVQTGKWMIFCSPTAVNEVWELVAGATANNELGIAAKVAPRPEFDELRKDRIICIYTADFKDKADVSRVLQRIRELRLADYYQRPIYYKPDVYTYLGIASGNPWGLRASIYSSKEFSKQLKA